MVNKKDNKEVNEKVQTKVSDEQILDECTDEYEELQSIASVKTNAKEEKISPNCIIKLKKYYKVCEYEINEYI